MERIPIFVATILLLHGPCYFKAPTPEASVAQAMTEVSVSVHFDKTKGELLLCCPKTISVGNRKTVGYSVQVVNHIEEEIFVQVRGTGGGELQFGWSPANDDDNGGLPPEMGDPLGWSKKSGLLALVEGAWRGKDGKLKTCGCCLARIEGTLDFSSVDLKQVVGKRLVMHIPIRGYFRTNGSEFDESVEVHLLVTK